MGRSISYNKRELEKKREQKRQEKLKRKEDRMMKDLVSMYHEAHRGKIDFEKELEKWVLGI